MSDFQPTGGESGLRVDLLAIADLIEPNSRVLDIGCGDGELLHFLSGSKDVDGRGIELSQAGVNACVSRGLSVVQGDADADLANYPEQAFDYVVLSQTLQATRNPRQVLLELVRIGRRAIVTFPNFGNWRIRWRLMTGGRMPMMGSPGEYWYETPNIHPCTIKDFVVLCRDLGLSIEHQRVLDGAGKAQTVRIGGSWANLFGGQGLFMLRRP